MDLKDKIVVVTGASKGIGRVTAIAFSRVGAKVVLVARSKKELDAVAKELPTESLVAAVDVSQEKDVVHLFEIVEKNFGRVDVLVNNAGVAKFSPLLSLSLEDWRAVVEPNLTGVFLCTREAVRLMKKKNVHGSIITVSSVLGFYTKAERSAYCASKHGVTGFMRSLKKELQKDGISVSLVYPARIATDILHGTETWKKWSVLDPEDIARLIVALASQSRIRIADARLHAFLKRLYRLFRYFPR